MNKYIAKMDKCFSEKNIYHEVANENNISNKTFNQLLKNSNVVARNGCSG